MSVTLRTTLRDSASTAFAAGATSPGGCKDYRRFSGTSDKSLDQPFAATNVLNISNNDPAYNDRIGVAYIFDYAPVDPYVIFDLTMLASAPKSPLSDAFPPSSIDPADFDSAIIWIRDSFAASGSPLDIKATITSVTVSQSVPDGGSTLVLLGVALVGLVSCRKVLSRKQVVRFSAR